MNYLNNWAEAGVEIEDYETCCLLDDADFDDFIAVLDQDEIIAIVDPLLDPNEFKLISGLPIVPVSRVPGAEGS